MYHRYKTRKKGFGPAKLAFLVLIIACITFAGYKYKDLLFFWKYSFNKLLTEVDTIVKIEDEDKRRISLAEVQKKVDLYALENDLSAEAYFLSARISMLIADSLMPARFVELLINDKLHPLKRSALGNYTTVIKKIKKGKAILNDGSLSKENTLMLSKALFFTQYGSISLINDMLENINNFKELSIEDKRFITTIHVLGNSTEINQDSLLKELGEATSTVDLLYRATLLRLAQKYTESIDMYKKVFSKSKVPRVHHLVHKNLGKIYYFQSLHKESIREFAAAQKIENKDPEILLWYGKNYNSLGNKKRARQYWQQVLSFNPGNREAQELMMR